MTHIYTQTLVRFCCSSLLDSTKYKLHSLQTHHPLFWSLKSISTSTNQHSFTVNYLINSCGLSRETAISASKHVNFETLEKPDTVLNIFKNHGFSKTQISGLIRKHPNYLLSDPEKTLLPKFEFFYSNGISSTELAKLVSAFPFILRQSLKNQIIPSFDLLKKFFHSDDKFITAFKRFPYIVRSNHYTFPNIEILRQHGVPERNIVNFITTHPRLICFETNRFKEVVEDIRKMGFNPSTFQFVMGVRVLLMSKSTWERKMEVYGKWGWSEEEIMSAFRRHAVVMGVSEEKIMAVMNFYVNTMGWESSLIAGTPELMTMSLGKKIIPRCSILQVLLSKGLIKKPVSVATLLRSTESVFLKKFVTCYEEAPLLLKLYQEKLDLSKLHDRNYEGTSGTLAL